MTSPREMTAWPSLRPRAEPASRSRMYAAQTRAELLLLMRNGEQVLLTLIIPLGLLLVLSKVPFVNVTGRRVDFFVPGVLALAVMSAAFTGQAIGTGFERQYGVLKRLGATPLPRSVLLLGKTSAVLLVEVLQVALICLVGLALGWHPHGNPAGVVALLVLGTAAFSGLGLLLGGTLRGLTTLAAANLLWFVLLALGGVLYPLSELGPGESVCRWLPTAALSDGLRQLLQHSTMSGQDLLALALWAVAGLTAASRLFRWE